MLVLVEPWRQLLPGAPPICSISPFLVKVQVQSVVGTPGVGEIATEQPCGTRARAVLALTQANLVTLVMEETMRSSLRLSVVLVAALVVGMVEGGSNFADNLAECSAVQELNICLREVRERSR